MDRDEARLAAARKALDEYIAKLKQLRAEEAKAFQQGERQLGGIKTGAAVEEIEKYIKKIRELSETIGLTERDRAAGPRGARKSVCPLLCPGCLGGSRK